MGWGLRDEAQVVTESEHATLKGGATQLLEPYLAANNLKIPPSKSLF